MSERLQAVGQSVGRRNGHPPVLTVMPQLRPLLARYAKVFSPGLQVLSQNEIPEQVTLNVVGTLG